MALSTHVLTDSSMAVARNISRSEPTISDEYLAIMLGQVHSSSWHPCSADAYLAIDYLVHGNRDEVLPRKNALERSHSRKDA